MLIALVTHVIYSVQFFVNACIIIIHLKVEHVWTVICCSGVLDEDGDVLLNVNIVDDEKAAKNVELKKGKPGYNPYDEEELDEFGNVS